MALPKKYNRRIVVDDEVFVWYLRGNEAWMGSKHIAIRHSQHMQGQLLLLDFYAHDFEIRPNTIRDAIQFALANGWTPFVNAKPLHISFDNIRFVLLPPGEQFLKDYQHPPSVTWVKPEIA